LEVEELAVWIGLFLALLFLVLFGLLLWVNRRVSRQVWQPFFNTLRQLRKFKLSENTALQLDDTPVEEFQELHHTLQALTNKLRADFQTVRQFTENASHELQTPLAVIQTKLDLLFQQAQLTEVQAQQLEFINQQTRRMSRLNQALLLLAKIENDQFAVRQEIALKPLLERKLEGLDDLIVAKNLVVETALNPVHIALNPELAETLFANLLGNAVKHNLDGGTLQLALTETELRIRNTCQTPAKPATELSGRFSRGNPQASGLGLGLAIAQEICDKSGLQLTLNVADGVWETLVSWTATS
jgi:signal transduction histidine kinase